MVSDPTSALDSPTRAARWAARRGRARRVALVTAAIVAVGGAGTGTVVALSNRSGDSGPSGPTGPSGKLASAHPTTTTVATTTTKPTTTTTIPPVRQPAAVALPPLPSNGSIGWGSGGLTTLAYELRLKQLHFDPGPVDGTYTQDTSYAVTTVEKLLGLPRDGMIGPLVKLGLEHFKYQPALPKAEGDRVEVNLDTQVITVYKNWQPILLTTTSTGSGEHFCGGTDGCQYAITPTGHFHFQYLHSGWDKGKLGNMWNPYYFNGGIAIHGLSSVPNYPASHGCARIPMDIANYFPTLVTKGESVYVVGTEMKRGSGYVGPAPTTAPTTSTTVPKTSTTKRHTTTTLRHPTTTAPHTTTTKKPKPTTTT
jgi:L,D-transpeptidase catalytic domain